MTRKRRIKINSPSNFNYRSNYRSELVVNSFENYDDRVKEALHLIYTNRGLTVYDFETAFISKLLSDDLVQACNFSKFDIIRHRISPLTSLKLTKLGCARIGQPYA